MDPVIVSALITLLGVVFGLLGGYAFGISQSRNERRDNALADINQRMARFYRSLLTWTSPRVSANQIAVHRGDWRRKTRAKFEEFLDCYYANSIWLGHNTKDRLQEFSDVCDDVINECVNIDAAGCLERDQATQQCTKYGFDVVKERVSPIFDELQDSLIDEMEASRILLPFRVVIKKEKSQ